MNEKIDCLRVIFMMKGMFSMVVNGINVTISGINDMSEQEVVAYIDMLQDENQDELSQLTISPAENGEVNLDYVLQPARFERIRRITGYLVGTLDRFNNAKRAEEHDRVKHDITEPVQEMSKPA